jgi:hypothetical protein
MRVYYEVCNPDPGIIYHTSVYHELINPDPGYYYVQVFCVPDCDETAGTSKEIML